MRNNVVCGATLGLMFLLSACGGVQYVPIDVQDNRATVLSVKANWHPWKQPAESVEQGFELQHIRVSGEDTQALAMGETMGFGGQSITGPQTVTNRVDITYTHLAYSGTMRLSKSTSPLDMDAFMGIGRVDFRLRSSGSASGPDALRADLIDYGLSMGLGLRWWFVKNNAIEGRLLLFSQNPLSYFAGTFGKGNQADLWEAELVWVFSPVKYVSIRAGYALLDCTPKARNQSSLEAKLRGPFLGLGVLF